MLVKARQRTARFVLILWPETGRVRGQDLIDQDQIADQIQQHRDLFDYADDLPETLLTKAVRHELALRQFLQKHASQAVGINFLALCNEPRIADALHLPATVLMAQDVGYGAEGRDAALGGLGLYIAVAIAIHNIPEGLAVALPMRARGASINRCFWMAFLTSLPQPIAAVPASLMVWFFQPLMLPMLGFAAGAMMYLVVVELIPDALGTRSPDQTAWAFMLGFGLMVLEQVAL